MTWHEVVICRCFGDQELGDNHHHSMTLTPTVMSACGGRLLLIVTHAIGGPPMALNSGSANAVLAVEAA